MDQILPLIFSHIGMKDWNERGFVSLDIIAVWKEGDHMMMYSKHLIPHF